MKKTLFSFILILPLLFSGCCKNPHIQIAATTQPVYEFTAALCEGTGLTVEKLITESVSCLHDYALKVDQVQMAESAELIVISGAGLEDFMADILHSKPAIDSSAGIPLLHESHDDDHDDELDPHIWLSPENAIAMSANICAGLSEHYPQFADVFSDNLQSLTVRLEALNDYGQQNLSSLSCSELITFHDGFSYFAEAFDLTILESMEEESGSEASARELIHLINLVESHQLPAIFTEINGSPSAASVVSAESHAAVYPLDMAMSGSGYFDTMYYNIDTVKEALG